MEVLCRFPKNSFMIKSVSEDDRWILGSVASALAVEAEITLSLRCVKILVDLNKIWSLRSLNLKLELFLIFIADYQAIATELLLYQSNGIKTGHYTRITRPLPSLRVASFRS